MLAQFYSQVFTLREYLLFKLSATSKLRQRKISKLGRKQNLASGKDCSALAAFLDNTLIGVLRSNAALPEERARQWMSFSQRADTSVSTLTNMSGTGNCSQSEVSVIPVDTLECYHESTET